MLYGISETINGNWSRLDMTSELGASTTQAALALTTFWAMVTIGRLLFAAIGRWLPSRAVYHLLPVVLVATFAVTAALLTTRRGWASWSSGSPAWAARPCCR